MKKNGYPGFFFWASFFVVALFLFIWWKNSVWQPTWGNTRSLWLICVLSLPLTVALFIWLKSKNVVEDLRHGLKLAAGLLLLSASVLCMLLYTVLYLTADRESHYTAAGQWTSGGRHGCGGMEIYEPELKKKIIVCEPYERASAAKNVQIYKRSSDYGIVVSKAVAY